MKKSEVSKKEIIKLIKKDGYNLTKYKKYLNQKSLIFMAANTYGSIIKHIDKKYRGNKALILKCVINNPYAFQYADKKLQHDEKIIKRSIQLESKTAPYPETMSLVGKNIKNIKLIKYAISKRGDSYLYINRIFKDDFELLVYALKRDGSAFWGAKKKFQRMKEITELAKKTGLVHRYPKLTKRPLKIPEDIYFYLKDKESKKKNVKRDVEEHRLYNGGLYWGTLLDDRPSGYGEFYNDDSEYGVEYKGIWEKGCFNGKGLLINYNDSSDTLWWTHEGEFKNGEADGKGKKITYDSDGKNIYEIEEGIFEKGFMDGKIKVIKKGKKYFNIYKKGRLIKFGKR